MSTKKKLSIQELFKMRPIKKLSKKFKKLDKIIDGKANAGILEPLLKGKKKDTDTINSILKGRVTLSIDKYKRNKHSNDFEFQITTLYVLHRIKEGKDVPTDPSIIPKPFFPIDRYIKWWGDGFSIFDYIKLTTENFGYFLAYSKLLDGDFNFSSICSFLDKPGIYLKDLDEKGIFSIFRKTYHKSIEATYREISSFLVNGSYPAAENIIINKLSLHSKAVLALIIQEDGGKKPKGFDELQNALKQYGLDKIPDTEKPLLYSLKDKEINQAVSEDILLSIYNTVYRDNHYLYKQDKIMSWMLELNPKFVLKLMTKHPYPNLFRSYDLINRQSFTLPDGFWESVFDAYLANPEEPEGYNYEHEANGHFHTFLNNAEFIRFAINSKNNPCRINFFAYVFSLPYITYALERKLSTIKLSGQEKTNLFEILSTLHNQKKIPSNEFTELKKFTKEDSIKTSSTENPKKGKSPQKKSEKSPNDIGTSIKLAVPERLAELTDRVSKLQTREQYLEQKVAQLEGALQKHGFLSSKKTRTEPVESSSMLLNGNMV